MRLVSMFIGDEMIVYMPHTQGFRLDCTKHSFGLNKKNLFADVGKYFDINHMKKFVEDRFNTIER